MPLPGWKLPKCPYPACLSFDLFRACLVCQEWHILHSLFSLFIEHLLHAGAALGAGREEIIRQA